MRKINEQISGRVVEAGIEEGMPYAVAVSEKVSGRIKCYLCCLLREWGKKWRKHIPDKGTRLYFKKLFFAEDENVWYAVLASFTEFRKEV